MKRCYKCKKEKKLSDFAKNKKSKDGLRSLCRECRAAYYQVNKGKIKIHRKVYRQKNKGKLAATKRAYDERTKGKRQKVRQANKERKAIYDKNYYQANKKRKKAAALYYGRKNAEKVKKISHRRRVLKRGAGSEKFLDIEVFERDGYLCGICSKKVNKRLKWPNPKSVSLDHIIPLSRGGQHTRTNTQCSHLVCNMSKSAKVIGQMLLELKY